MKKIFAAIATSFMMFSATALASDISVILNGEKIKFDQPPIIINDRTMVPMRGIFEAFGADVEWDQSTKTVTALFEGDTLTLQIGNYSVTKTQKNGSEEKYELDTPAQIVNDRTLVPVRFIAESLGANVGWDSSSSSVIITRKAYTISTIKSVDVMESKHAFGRSAEYSLCYRPFYAIKDDNIYYIDSQSVVKKLNIHTKEETEVLDFNKCMKRLSEEDDPSSSEDNIYLNGGEVEQLFYDRENDRVILLAAFPGDNGSIVKAFEVENNKLTVIMPHIADSPTAMPIYPGYFVAGIAGNKIITDEGYVFDSDTGIRQDNIGLGEAFGGNRAYKGKYQYNQLYYCYGGGDNVYVYVNDKDQNQEGKPWAEQSESYGTALVGKKLSADFYGDFIYALEYNGDISKYNLSGALKGVIHSSEIYVSDGVSKISGELMMTDKGDIVLFNGNSFRLISKN